MFPKGSSIIRKGESSSGAKLAQDLPPNLNEPTAVEVDNAVFVRDLKPGERLEVTANGKNRLLTFLGVGKIEIKLRPPLDPPPSFPADTFITLAKSDADSTTLAADYPGSSGESRLLVRDVDLPGPSRRARKSSSMRAAFRICLIPPSPRRLSSLAGLPWTNTGLRRIQRS